MSKSELTAGVLERAAMSAKSVIKMLLQSGSPSVERAEREKPLIVMGNGPSLNEAMAEHGDSLRENELLAVNFAANAPQFREFKPDYYVMADPVFFNDLDNANVARLWHNLSEEVDWPMTLFVPVRTKLPVSLPENVRVSRFNAVGVEGFGWLERWAYRRGYGMPRPRNVLIPAIMIGLSLGFKEIYLAGADHSWSRTLEVTDENVVVSVQPHFYEDNAAEHARVASVYKDVRLHQIMYSFYVAFRSYFRIRSYAESVGAAIYNSTPGSFIDAFTRKALP